MTDYNIIPTALAIKAMLDNGYKNAAYAVAELVDNSVEADATEVHVIAVEEQDNEKVRVRSRVKRVVIADNGCGMSPKILRQALQFGNGTRLQSRRGIGRFGMGLPNASLSQANKVEVYSWTNSSPVHYTYIDVQEIQSGAISDVPQPEPKALPLDIAGLIGDLARSESGTVVVWSQVERLKWRKGDTLIRNTEPILGRVYRKQLDDGRVRLLLRCWRVHEQAFSKSIDTRPVDPLGLMKNTQAPSPYDEEPAFEAYGDPYEVTVSLDGQRHTIRVTVSVARKEARHDGGASGIGKFMAQNVGVSVMRADRELALQRSWTNQYDPRERWWGVEIDFPPSLDTIFGVDNSKQNAFALDELGQTDLAEIAKLEDVASVEALKAHWERENDPRLALLLVSIHVKKTIKTLRGLIQAQAKPKKKRVKDDPATPEQRGTKKTEMRKREGNHGRSDKDEARPDSQRANELADDLAEREGLSDEQARDDAVSIIRSKQKYSFYTDQLDSSAFFTCRNKAGVIRIGVNTDHPAYHWLIGVLDEETEAPSREVLAARLQKSNTGLKLLLEAWARLEDEAAASDGHQRLQRIRRIREDWGSMTREFLSDD